MNHFLFFLFILFIIACNISPKSTTHSKEEISGQRKNNPPNQANLIGHDFDWLMGKWSRINDKKDRSTYEYWQKSTNDEYNGLGYTLENKDTVFKEMLKLVKIDDIWNLEVTGVNETPTYFKFTSQSPISFVCENPQNEFPKKIAYTLKGDTLSAKVSDNEMVIPFVFVKSNGL